jgi:hypothetical protein
MSGDLTYFVNGKPVTREEFVKGGKLQEIFDSGATALGQSSSGWPKSSLAMSVHPTQISEASEHARKSGVPTDFNMRGEPILVSPSHQRRYAKQVLGYSDLSTREITCRPEDCTR